MASHSPTPRKLQYYTVWEPSPPPRNRQKKALPAASRPTTNQLQQEHQAGVTSANDNGSLVAAAVRGGMKPTSFLSKGGSSSSISSAKAIDGGGAQPMTPEPMVTSDVDGGAGLGMLDGGVASPSPVRIVSDITQPGAATVDDSAAAAAGAASSTTAVSRHIPVEVNASLVSTVTSIRPNIAALDRQWKAAAAAAAAATQSTSSTNAVAPFKYVNERKRPADDTAVQQMRNSKRHERADNWGAKPTARYSLQFPLNGMDLSAEANQDTVVKATTSTSAETAAQATNPSMSKTYALVQSVRNAQQIQRAVKARSSFRPLSSWYSSDLAAKARSSYKPLSSWYSSDLAGKTAPGDYINQTPLTDAGDRPYNVWRGASGQLERTFGALLPTGYKLSEDPDHPFACPIRDCQVSSLYKSLRELGDHFTTHKGMELNDNRDGTFSLVKYKPAGLAGFPPIVCSRTPLVSKPVPHTMARTQQQGSTGLATRTPSIESSALPAKPSSQQPQLTVVTQQTALAQPSSKSTSTTAWEYFSSVTAVKKRLDTHNFNAIADLPHKRDLPPQWLSMYGARPELSNAHVYTALAFICGDEAEVPCEQCQKGRFGKSTTTLLGPPCVVLPVTAREKFAESKKSNACMSCLLVVAQTRAKIPCSFSTHISGRQHKFGAAVTASASAASTPTAGVSWSSAVSVSSTGSTLRSGDAPVPESASSDSTVWENPENPIAAAMAHIISTPAASVESLSATRSIRKSIADARVARESRAKARESAARTPVDQEEEGEEWEMAPGQACVDLGYGPKAIAFSHSYLTSADPVNIDSSLQANWLTLEPGKKHAWSARDDRTRICTVVQGRVRISFAGAAQGSTIIVGRRGDFKIPMNMACDATNVGAGGAEVHVTTVIEPGALIWEKDSAYEGDGCDC